MNQKTRLPDAKNCSITKNFTQIPNQLLRNNSISGKAKSILCLLLSNKDGWYTYFTTIKSMMKEKEGALYSGVKELEGHNYLMRIKYRDKRTKRYAGVLWAYTDIPGNFNLSDNLKDIENAGYEPIIPGKSNPGKSNPGKSNPNNINNNNNKNVPKGTLCVSNETPSGFFSSFLPSIQKEDFPSSSLERDCVEYWNKLPSVPKHTRRGTKVRKTAGKYIRQLFNGRFEQDKKFKVGFFNDYGIPSKWLIKKWSREEIKEGLNRLSLLYQEGYWPRSKEGLPKDLSSLLFNPGAKRCSSYFLLVMNRKPEVLINEEKPKGKFRPKSDDNPWRVDAVITEAAS